MLLQPWKEIYKSMNKFGICLLLALWFPKFSKCWDFQLHWCTPLSRSRLLCGFWNFHNVGIFNYTGAHHCLGPDCFVISEIFTILDFSIILVHTICLRRVFTNLGRCPLERKCRTSYLPSPFHTTFSHKMQVPLERKIRTPYLPPPLHFTMDCYLHRESQIWTFLVSFGQPSLEIASCDLDWNPTLGQNWKRVFSLEMGHNTHLRDNPTLEGLDDSLIILVIQQMTC